MTTELQVVPPDDIDLEFVPQPRTAVAMAAVGDEMLLVGMGTPMVLNPTGSLIWQCLDGAVSLGELSDELSEELGIDVEVVRHDVVAFARSLGAAGLLEGVGIVWDPSDFEFDQSTPLDVGDEFEWFTLPDAEGTEHALADWRGRRVLLLNWSPGCGYCTAIAPSLAEAEPALGEAGVELLFVASGDAATNQPILEDAGIDAVMLYKTDEIDPFTGFGTPMAYLLDEDGRVATAVGWGADQTLSLVEAVAGITLTSNPFARADAPAADDPGPAEVPVDDPARASDARYLPAAGGMCGPGATSGPKTDWVGTVAYAIGEWHVGVRHNGDVALDALDRVLPGARTADGRVPDNYSVALSPASGKGARELNLLVKGSQQLVRSRSAARVVRGLLTYLAFDLEGPDPDLLTVGLAAVVRDGTATFVPNDVTVQRDQAQPRLARLGYQLVDAPVAIVDPARRELVVPELSIPHDAAALAALAVDTGSKRELPEAPPGRYPIAGWVFRGDPDAGPVTPAMAVAALVPYVSRGGDDDDVMTIVATLTELLHDADVRSVQYETIAELVAALR